MAKPSVSSSKTGLQPPAGFIDRCWTVPVIAGSMTFLVSIAQTNFGLLFVLLMDHFDASRSSATWPKSLDLAMNNLMGIALGAIQHHVSIHNTILAGAVMCPAALIASAFVPNMTWMSVTLGLLYGASFGIVVIASAVRIQSCFDKFRGIATGLQYQGVSLSGIIGPVLLSHLADEYGLRGTLILTGGMALNLIPLSILLRFARPTNCCSRRRRKPDSHPVNRGDINLYGTADRADNGFHGAIKKPELVRQKLPEEGVYHVSAGSDAFGRAELAPQPEECSVNQPDNLQGGVIALGFMSQAITVLKSPCFYVLLVAMAAADITLSLLCSTIVDYAGDKGVPLDAAAQVMTFLCFGGFLGHIVMPLVADEIAHSRTPITALGLALLSLCFWLMPHVGGLWPVGAIDFVAGVQQGCINTFKPVLVADYLGVENIAAVWGLIGLVTLPLLLCEPSIVGAFRDVTGSYDNLYRLFGGVDLFAAALLLALACYDAKKRRAQFNTC